jgi:peptidoglycan L-alanyl-D-glutamate endopeptidase CwlK
MTPLNSTVGENAINLQEDVIVVQRLLKVKGISPGPVDGICGPKTVRAIRQFQSKFLSKPDGVVEPGRKTWFELTSDAQTAIAKQPSQWSGDSARWSQEKKLQSLNPLLKTKVTAVLLALKKRGYQPKIFYGWRSVATQLKLYAQGNSKVKFSFHNVQQPNGTPNSYAADIIDKRYGWSPKAKSSGFWKALGEEAKKQKLYWGGDWKGFRDWAHVQLSPNSDLSKVKKQSGL